MLGGSSSGANQNREDCKMKRAGVWSLGIVLFFAAAATAYRLFSSPAGSGANSAGSAPAARPLPVTAAIVETKDFPIYRVGLGTVQAYNTVTVKVRVDGEIQRIAFREGQDVRTGDLLAQIDPRPYQALLHQAE